MEAVSRVGSTGRSESSISPRSTTEERSRIASSSGISQATLLAVHLSQEWPRRPLHDIPCLMQELQRQSYLIGINHHYSTPQKSQPRTYQVTNKVRLFGLQGTTSATREGTRDFLDWSNRNVGSRETESTSNRMHHINGAPSSTFDPSRWANLGFRNICVVIGFGKDGSRGRRSN